MGQFLEYVVSVIDDGRHRHLADFRRLRPAIAAARLALDSPRVTLAVVKRGEVMVFAADRGTEWHQIAEDARSGEFRDFPGVVPMN
jgi:hypothetical protein